MRVNGLYNIDGVWRTSRGVPMWITRDNQQIALSDMETEHIRRCIARIFLATKGWRKEYLPHLVEELKKRSD